MQRPTKSGDLLQFNCATNWMRSSIPNYSHTMAPLQELIERVYKSKGKRTRRAVSTYDITDLWGDNEEASFQTIQLQLANAVRLAHPKSGHTLCLFTDASDTHWSGILIQVPAGQMNLPTEDQDHHPLAFQSGALKGASERWSTVEKEGYALVESLDRFDFLVAGRELSIFTDHANLIYIFDPTGQNPGIQRHTASKLMRWALRLSGYRYTIEHLAGGRNLWADLLTRWAGQVPKATKVIKLAKLMTAPIDSMKNELDWPTRDELRVSQTSASPELLPDGIRMVKDLWQDAQGRVWIPQNNRDMQVRLLVAAHMGAGGHVARNAAFKTMGDHFIWDGMKTDCDDFCRSCLHCLATNTGPTVPRPMGSALHSDTPNGLLHFDYCWMGEGGEKKYILILKYDLSSFVRLVPTSTADAETTADALIAWFSDFGVAITWVSDRGSHFKNEVMRALREQTRGRHHFTLAYCPWSNGTVKRVCRELLRVTRALMSEFKLSHGAWPSVIPLVQAGLNNAASSRMGGKCPKEVFIGLPPDPPLLSEKACRGSTVEVMSLPEIKAVQLLKMQRLHLSIQEMHKEVSRLVSKSRQKAIDYHNAKTHVRAHNFDVGDFVLSAGLSRTRKEKLSLHWHGPHRVTKCASEYVKVQDLKTGIVKEVHCTRLKFFRNAELSEENTELVEHLSYQNGELCVVEYVTDLREHEGAVQLMVKWRGFAEVENTWEDYQIMQHDVPIMLKDFILEMKTAGTPRQRAMAAKLDGSQ
jgi:hypothetical protein